MVWNMMSGLEPSDRGVTPSAERPLMTRTYRRRATSRFSATQLGLLLHAAYAEFRSMSALTELRIEPAARRLGDRWADDDCGEYEVTLGLCRLQTVVREIAGDSVQRQNAHPLVVLVAPLPGEIHMLGASLDAEALWQAGQDTRIPFPSTQQALKQIVATNWFDAIDLSISPAVTRKHRADQMTHIIDAVRRAAHNPAWVVVAGGRAFYDRRITGADADADEHARARRARVNIVSAG